MPFQNLGYYSLVIIVDGIESSPSYPPIKVVKIEKDRDYYMRFTLEIYL